MTISSRKPEPGAAPVASNAQAEALQKTAPAQIAPPSATNVRLAAPQVTAPKPSPHQSTAPRFAAPQFAAPQAAPQPQVGQSSGTAPPVNQYPAIDPQIAALSQLLRIEAEARQSPNEAALQHLIANETRGLVRARQVFVIRRRASRHFRVQTVSSLAVVERDAPMIQWVERLMRGLAKENGTAGLVEFALPAYTQAGDTITSSYPFPHLLWVPLWSRTDPGHDGVLLARETAWLEADQRIAARVAETYGHALQLHRSRPRRAGLRLPVRLTTMAIVGAIIAAGFIPVPMTALAPLEVTARDPQTVTMPMEGIVHQVLVEPNTAVLPGQRLVQLVDTVPRNKLNVAEREVQVAAAKLEQASSLSFSDARGRHALGIARAELELKQAERDYAKVLLDKTVIVARKAGIAVFPDRKELEGKPLPVGEKIMLIADPTAVELKIDLAVADSVVLAPGTRVKAFIDADPLHPIEARVAQIDYQAKLSETGVAAYRMIAALAAADTGPPQLGVRGTAQLYGPTMPLGVFLLRRPLSATRQWAGL